MNKELSKLTFGQRIKLARKQANLTQEELANLISNMLDNKKISRTSITQWECGKTKEVEGSNLIKAAKILNVTPEWLVFGILRI
jgi:transcriptional regulator with XRE-family HTH domain